MSSTDNPFDSFNAINEARREAREHSDALAFELRGEAHRDRERSDAQIASVQRETRQHVNSLAAAVRNEMREDRTEILAAINASRLETKGDIDSLRSSVHDDVDTLRTSVHADLANLATRQTEIEKTVASNTATMRFLQWLIVVAIAVATLIFTVLQYQAG